MSKEFYERKYIKYKLKYLNEKIKMMGGVGENITAPCWYNGNIVNVKNVAGLILTKSNNVYKILLLRDIKNKLWMTPGGGISSIDLKSHPCFSALKREFKEETGSELPKLKGISGNKEVDKYLYNNDTMIFIGIAKEQDIDNVVNNFKETKETDKIGSYDLESVIRGTANIKLKGYVSNSLNEIKGILIKNQIIRMY
ncbi:MAG: NUDIX hydrolase [Thermoplasmata archaeon]